MAAPAPGWPTIEPISAPAPAPPTPPIRVPFSRVLRGWPAQPATAVSIAAASNAVIDRFSVVFINGPSPPLEFLVTNTVKHALPFRAGCRTAVPLPVAVRTRLWPDRLDRGASIVAAAIQLNSSIFRGLRRESPRPVQFLPRYRVRAT